MDIQNKTREELLQIIGKLQAENHSLRAAGTKGAVVEPGFSEGYCDMHPIVSGISNRNTVPSSLEDKFSRLFYMCPLACGLSSADDHTYIEVNDAFCTLLGFEKEEVTGKTAESLGILTSETRADVMRYADATGKILNAVTVLKAKDGELKRVELSGEDFIVQDKKYRFTVVYDLTELRKAEKKLRETQELYQLLFNTSLDAILMTTPDGRILSANKSACTIFGRTEEELIRLGRECIIDPSDPRLAPALAERAQTGRFCGELNLVRKDGSKFPAEITSSVFLDNEGRDRTSMIIRDITERKVAEENLRASEEKYKQLFDHSLDHIFILEVTDDQRFKVLAANPTHEKELGNLRPGAWIEDCLSKEACDQTLQNYRRCLAEQKILSFEERYSEHDFFTQLIPVRNSNNVVYRIIGIARNITKEKELTNRLINHNEELKTLNDDLVSAKEILTASEAKFRTLFRNSPVGISMTSIDGYLNVNQAFCNMVGYSGAEMTTKRWMDITFPEDIEQTRRHLQSLLDAKNTVVNFENRYVHKKGQTIWAYVSILLQRDINGNPDFYLTTVVDITQRKLNEERIRILSLAIEQNPVSIMITDADGTIEYVNPVFTQITGYRTDEVVGDKPRILNAELTPKEVYEDLWKTITSGQVWKGSFQNRRKNGDLYYESSTISPILDENKHITHFLAIKEDITKTIRSEYLIRTYVNAIEQSPSSVIVTNATGDIEFVNKKFQSFTQYSLKDVKGKKPRIFNPHHMPPELYDVMWKTLRSGSIWEGESLNRKKDRTEFWEHVIISPLVKDDGSIINYTIIMDDITPIKTMIGELTIAKEIAEENEQKYKQLFDNTLDHIFLLKVTEDNRFKVLAVNPMHIKEIGMLHPNAYVEDCLPEEIAGQVIPNYCRCVSEARRVSYEEHLFGCDFFTQLIPITGSDDVVYRIIGIARDITKEKELTNQLIRQNEELEQRVLERTSQLEAANREMETFSYSVAHDLRAPLRAITGFSSLLAEGYNDRLDQEGQRFIATICQNTSKMDRLITDMLSLSQVSRAELNIKKVNMRAFAEAMFRELATDEEKTEFDFSVGKLPVVSCDEMLIKQVWQNLISNALKYSSKSERKQIRIGFRNEKTEFIFYIRDRGIGFNEKYKDKLFGVFQRLLSAREFEGTGVGLAIVQRIINRHGGRVWAEGELNKGATFYFTLPKV
ncbi:MAG TPA: PAS domain S-box protein [Bacteroidales bacterium]|nr:PAS domain S-box protein [Bacteroidales bacterium]